MTNNVTDKYTENHSRIFLAIHKLFENIHIFEYWKVISMKIKRKNKTIKPILKRDKNNSFRIQLTILTSFIQSSPAAPPQHWHCLWCSLYSLSVILRLEDERKLTLLEFLWKFSSSTTSISYHMTKEGKINKWNISILKLFLEWRVHSNCHY